MSTINVSNQAGLLSALSSASGGDTIVLANGNYGNVVLSNDYASTVKITAATKHGATFSNLDFNGASNIHIDQIVVDSSIQANNGAHHLTYTNSKFMNGLQFTYVDNFIVDNNELANNLHTLIIDGSTNFQITNNDIHDARSDLVRITGKSKYGLIENNTIRDVNAHLPDHPDMIQFIGLQGVNPTDMTIRGNLIYDNRATGSEFAQGIFMSDSAGAGYTNMLIENNLIAVGSPNSIYINGGQSNVVVQNNTLMPWSNNSGATIRLVNKNGYDNSGTTLRDNIAMELLDETRSSTLDGNYFYGRNADMSKLFSGDGDVWQDFLPPAGSPISFGAELGAFARLIELQGGAPVTPQPAPTAPAPTPTPSAPAPTPPATTGTDLPASTDILQIKSASDVVEVATKDLPALDSGAIEFVFNAADLSGRQGLVSRDASGAGDHFTSYLDSSTLVVRFQTSAGQEKILSMGGVQAGKDYDVDVSFGNGQVSLEVNNAVVGTQAMDWDWSGSTEYLQIGANGWASASGSAGFTDVFNGTIRGFSIDNGPAPATGGTTGNVVVTSPTGSGTTSGGGGSTTSGGGATTPVAPTTTTTTSDGAGGSTTPVGDNGTVVKSEYTYMGSDTVAAKIFDLHKDTLDTFYENKFVRAPNKSVLAKGGNDGPQGGPGQDVLFSGELSDTFVFNAKVDGHDHLVGLESWDNLVFEKFGYKSGSDAISHMVQQGADVYFADQGVEITFVDTQLVEINASMIGV